MGGVDGGEADWGRLIGGRLMGGGGGGADGGEADWGRLIGGGLMGGRLMGGRLMEPFDFLLCQMCVQLLSLCSLGASAGAAAKDSSLRDQ
uniref:Uncharacterized protein n=1 Tax=Knipowitschia caucasica TaxID=637954 RepID=A0AAV2LP02_KNICA